MTYSLMICLFKGGHNKKPIEQNHRTRQQRKVHDIIDSIKDRANDEITTPLKLIALIGKIWCNGEGKNKKLGKIFSDIYEQGNDYVAPSKEISVEKAVMIKNVPILSFSRRGMEFLMLMLRDHVNTPGRDSITALERKITPAPIPWLGGTKYDFRECLEKTILEIFTVHNIPLEALPPQGAQIKGGLGYDAAGGYPLKKGGDVVLDTTHR